MARVKFNAAGDPVGVERLGIALEPEAEYERRPDGASTSITGWPTTALAWRAWTCPSTCPRERQPMTGREGLRCLP